MLRETNTLLFLLVAVLSVNIYPSTCLPVLDRDPETCDPCYEENKQELSDEIDDVNDYMQMVSDKLTNDGVIVVRAVRTRFTTAEMENVAKPNTSALGVEDSGCDQPKETKTLETTASTKTDIKSLRKDQNIPKLSKGII